MKLFFGGAEVPGWRNLLAAERVEAVSLSFVGLSKRVRHLTNWSLAEKFPVDPGFRQDLFLDSGAYSLNKAGSEYTDVEALQLAAAYFTFVAANIERIDVFSEFDAMQLDGPARMEAREALAELGHDKFMPIWHPEQGTDELEYLAEHFERVGVKQPERDDMGDLTPVLRRIARRTKLHGVAMTRMKDMREIMWDSVGSTSWLSPGRTGDTIIWDGKELHRFPMKYKKRSRMQHRSTIDNAGFDAVAVARDATDQGTSEDRKEVLRLSLWSWGQFVDDINRRREAGEFDPKAADEKPMRGKPRGEVAVVRRDKQLLPVLSITQGTTDKDQPETQVDSNATNLMRCNNCFVRDKCPMFQPDAECAYEIPMQIRTTTQRTALRKAMIEIQAQRVMTLRMFEQLEGGMAMQDLTREMQLLSKMMADDANAEKDGFTLEIKASGSGEAGMLSRIFGSGVENQVNALNQPFDANQALEGYWEAETVEDD